MSGGYTLNQIRDDISKCCVVVEGFPPGTEKQSFAHIFQHKRAKQVEDGLKWLIMLQGPESAKEWVNRGSYKVFNFTLDIVASTGSDIPDDWLQDDQAKSFGISEASESKQNDVSSNGESKSVYQNPSAEPMRNEPDSMTSKVPLASGPQIVAFEQMSSKSDVAPMYYPNYQSMPMTDSMEPPPYDSHNFQFSSPSGPLSMQSPQSAQIHVLYSKEEKPSIHKSFDKCPVKTPAQDTSSDQKNSLTEKQASEDYDSIKVSYLPGSITEDSISDFFENVKRSGGGSVSKVEYHEEKKTAIVTFEDSNVVKNVLEKHASSPLLMNKQQIEIEMYIPKTDMEKQNQTVTAVHVRNLPEGTNDEQIELFFENHKKSGGGEVEKVEYDETSNSAVVWFKEAEIVESVLQKHESTPLMMNKQQIEVEEYRPPQEDSDGISKGLNEKSTIKVTKLPTGISEEQIALFFENYKKSGGGEVEKVEYDENTNTAIVWFEEAQVVKRVLQKHESTPLMMNKQQIEVEEYHPPQEDSDGISEGLNEKRTIKVTKLPTGISEEQIALFFENYKKSGGGEVEKVEYDENTNTAIVWFEEAQVVKSVLQKHESTPLMMNKQQIEVEEYHPPQEDSDGISEGLNEKRTIKVTKLPTGISEEQIALFFENYKKSGGGEVEKVEYDENTNTAIVWFEDAQVVASVLQKQESSTLTMNKQKIDVEEYHPPQEDSDRKFEGLDEGRTIKVTKLPTGISEEQIALFFENYKKSGGGEVEKVEYDEDIDTAIVWFEDAQVVTSVLQKHAGTPLTINKQKIDVEEYHPCKEEVENSSEVEQYQGGAIKITKLPPGTSEEQILLFFENRKMSGGGEVVKVEYNKNTDSAIVWFEDADVVSRVLQRIPLLFNKKQIYVEEVRLDGKSVEKEAEEDTLGPLCTIEVRGMKETTSRENIELYFDNKKKSGGGGVEDVKGEVEDGVLYITFENEKNVEEVMKQEHKVDGVILDVKIYHPPKPIPVYPDRVLITGFKTGTTKDGLTNFLEARTGEDVKEVVFDQEQEMAIIIFQEIKDFLKLEEICQKKPLEKHFLSVKKVSISNCIIVTGFAENTAESTIEFYFDNERRSGGGVVTEVKINKDDDTCLVYFEDHTVCDRVCQKGHMLENMKLTVHTFYECLGPPFNPEEGPKFRPVEPLVVKNLNLRKMKFVLSSEEYRKVFDKQAESNHGKIKWPSKAATELTVECTLSKEVKDCRKLAKTWKDHMVDVIKKLLEVLHVEAVNVLQEAWQKSLEEIQKLNVPDPRKVGIITEKSNFTIVIVGYEKLFEGVKSEVRLTISKVVDEIQLKKKLVKERVPLKRYQLLLLSNDNFTEATEKEFPNMKVTLDIQDKSVTFDGLYSDVSKAKLSVLEKCQQMCQASAGKFSKNRQEFLSRNEVYARISKELKNKKNLSCFEFQKDELMFYAFSDDKAVEAAHLVKNYIAESPIDVQTDSVYLLNSEKWKKQVKKLESSQDFEGLLQIITEADQRKIVIVTVSEYVGLAREFVEDFLRDNTIISDTMDIPPSLSKFMELHHAGKLEQISESLKEQQVRIKKNNNKIDIEGTQKGLNRAKKNIEDFLKGIQWKKQKLERPGIAKHLKSSSGKSKISEVQKNHKCYIQIGEDGSTDLSNFWTATSNSKQKQDSNKRMTGYLTKEGVSIKVHSGDLTALPVDVIVNAANSELYHQGGLAGVIVTKGGNEIQIECSDYVRRKGKLFEGDTFCSKAGQLSCKMIVHACGPTWRGGMNQESERLTDCVESALTETEKMGYNSIAIPGLCTGIFGYPVNQATSVIVKAMKSYLKNRKGSTIEEIILCDVREETVKYFNEAVKQEFKGKIQNVGDSAHAHFQDGQTQSHDTEFKTGGIRVKLVKGQMAQRKVDIIVNTAAKDLNLSQGAVSASLLNLGGIDIQRECHSKYPHGIEFGDIAVTSGGKLNCKNIFHGALQNWDKEKGVAKTGLQKFMKTCLTEVQNMKFSSIAFPAFGTGNLGYPKDIVADEMCNAVVNFSKDNPDTCLKNVEFVIYEKDKVSIQIFEKEMSSRAKEVIQVKIKTQRKRHGGEHVGKTFGSDSQKEVSVDFGPIKLRMYQGDITLADVDAIVNGTDSEMDLSKGEVSRTIMSKLGVELQRQIDIQKKTMHEYGMAVTANGDKSKLPSKYIIHVNLAGGNYKRKIMSVFQKAEEMGMKTIALPALGTGQQSFHQRKIEDFAQEVFDGLNRMSSDVKNLTEVHVIIFDHQQAVQFIVEMEKCFESQGSKPKGWFKGMVDAFKYYVTGGKSDGSGQWKPVLTDKPDDQSSVTIVVFADNQKNLDAGLRKLENLVNADFKTRDIRDSAIPHLSLEQMKALKNLEDEFDVEINIDRDGGIVTLLGTSESLLDATSYVKDMLRNVDRNKLEAEYVSDVVMWYYVDNSDGKNELCDYPKNINLLVEKAYSNKQPDVKFLDVQGTQYTIDFSSMVEYPSDDPTDVLTVTRRDKIKASTFEPPPEWTAMSESENLVVIQVPSGSQEYLKVIDRFQGELQTSGIKSDIIKLERIQNKMLYQQYVAKKKLLDSQNPPGTKNERELWHGTAPEAVNSVNSLGFNRSYCGKNAAVHGNGVYFAVDAEYSARETYSKPDPNGHKRIYLCKVLTGEFTLGKKDMRVPPPKDVNQPHILYDSVVYPLQDPEMFIIFNDTQGYPSYLITFIKTK